MKHALCIFVLWSTYSAPARSNSDREQAEVTVLALENAWNQAVHLKESRALQPLLLEGLIYIEGDGRLMSKGQYLSEVNARLVRPEHVASEFMHAHSYGSTVIVTGVYRESGSRRGTPYILQERFIDTWVQQRGAWVCVASQSTPVMH